MILSRKISNALKGVIFQNKTRDDYTAELTTIADEFAIGFAEWLNNGRFSQYGSSWVDPRKNKNENGDWLFFSSKQLLEIYKKEKEL
jgi:hypothetical protein